MLTPNNESGEKTDKIMLLAMWTETLRQEGQVKSIIAAGMGKPTYPVNIHTVEMYLQYWNRILSRLHAIADGASEAEMSAAAIDYGDPRGDFDAKGCMSRAMTIWYETEVLPEHILFTVGGAGALRIIFETFNDLNADLPAYRVITPFPHYTLYKDNRHCLHPINLLDEPGYRLSGKALKKSIDEAYELAKRDNNLPKSIFLCNPNNPLGTAITEAEWTDLIPVLRQYPDLKIVIDEAYAEMCWTDEAKCSLIKLAPDLKERVIILRSATKAHSAAGERMAMLMAFDKKLMSALTNKNIGVIGHAPRSAQIAYAHTMEQFGEDEAKTLRDFYEPKVEFVKSRLAQMGACMPDPTYRTDGTFYVMADFSDLFGMDIPKEARRALGKVGRIKTSEELIYSLLFKDGLMLAPGEYFGFPQNKGYVRITCSGPKEELAEMMHRLESVLFDARKSKYDSLLNQVIEGMKIIETLDSALHRVYLVKLSEFAQSPADCHEYKERNNQLKSFVSEINIAIMRSTPEGQNRAARTIQSFFRQTRSRKQQATAGERLETAWRDFVDVTVADGPVKNYMLNLSTEERESFKPWVEYLKLHGISQHGNQL